MEHLNISAYKLIDDIVQPSERVCRETPKQPETDGIVKAPSHYERYKQEPINFIMLNDMEFWRGNIIKYVSRAGFKPYPNQDPVQSEITDLQKVIRYAEMRINQLEGRNPNQDG